MTNTSKVSFILSCFLLTTLLTLTRAHATVIESFNTRPLTVPEDSSDHKENKAFSAQLGVASFATSNRNVPFWLRSNRYGDIPISGLSVSAFSRLVKHYNSDKNKKLVDWGANFEGRAITGNSTKFLLIEGHVKGRLGVVELRVGRSRDVSGLVDTTLSSGAFSISGNSLGIPKVEIGVRDYYSIPILHKLVAFKGNFAHGWFGKTTISNFPNLNAVNSYYHQKSLYLRFGEPHWKLKVYGGFNHQVMWGNERKMYGRRYTLSQMETFFYAITGKGFGGGGIGIPRSRVGNHLGSLDLAAEYRLGSSLLTIYHQFYYDVGGLYHLNNVKDGLSGISLKNTTPSKDFHWTNLLVEFIHSKSQGGELDAKVTPSGDENYYNNYIYSQGWSYKGENLGNPLMTSRKYIAKSNVTLPVEYISNNRIIGFHLGGMASSGHWTVGAKLTYTRNFGTYGTSPIGTSLGGTRKVYGPPFFDAVNQFSGILEVGRNFARGIRLNASFAGDSGYLLNKSVGGSISLVKSW